MTLNEAIALALRNNISVQNIYLSRVSDKFGLLVTQDEFEPQYSLSGSVSRSSSFDDSNKERIDSSNQNLNAGISLQLPHGGQLALTTAYGSAFQDDTDDSYRHAMYLSFTQPLLRGAGRTVGSASLTQADYSEQSSLLSLQNVLINVVSQVITRYRSYVLAQYGLKIAELSLERSQRQLEITELLIQAGRQPKVELIQSQTSLANQQLSLRSAQNQADSARLAFLRLLRLDETVYLELTEPIEIVPFALTLEKVLEITYRNRPDYLQNLIALQSAELQKILAEDTQRWQLDLTATYNLDGSDDNAHGALKPLGRVKEGGYSVGLSLTIPIDDIGLDQNLLNANINLIQTKNSLIDSKESIRLEMIDALRNLEISLDQVRLAKRSLDLTRIQLELEQDKLKAGRSSNFQVVNFQNQLTSAEEAYISSQISYLNALTSLDQQMGTTLAHWGVSIEPDKGLGVGDIDGYGISGTAPMKLE